MPYIQEIKRTNGNEPVSFKVVFQLGVHPDAKPITRTEIWTAPEGLSKNEALRSIHKTAEAWEKFLKSLQASLK